jgi:hypothetical protein
MSSKTNKIDSEDDDLTSIENTQEDLNTKEVSKLSLFSQTLKPTLLF